MSQLDPVTQQQMSQSFPTLSISNPASLRGGIKAEKISADYEKIQGIIREFDPSLAQNLCREGVSISFGTEPKNLLLMVPAIMSTESGRQRHDMMWEKFGSGVKSYLNMKGEFFPFVFSTPAGIDSISVNPTSALSDPDQNYDNPIESFGVNVFLGAKLLREIPKEFKSTQNRQNAYRFAMLLALVVHEGYHLGEPEMIHLDSTMPFGKYVELLSNTNPNYTEGRVYTQEIDFLRKYMDSLTDRKDSMLKQAIAYIIAKETKSAEHYNSQYQKSFNQRFSALYVPPRKD